MHDLIIIGNGAAGISAALFALTKQLDALSIYEDVGGKAGTQQQISGQVGEEYIAGAEAVQLFERRVIMHAHAVLRDRVIGIEKQGGVFLVETQRHGVQRAHAVLMATGASPLRLDVPGAKQLLNHGIGYSITTHTALVAGKPVAVIGSTRRALRGVIELARSAAQIFLITPSAQVLGTPLGRIAGALPNVQLLAGAAVREIVGDENVEHVVIERDGEQSWLPVAAVFADIGLLPNSALVRRIAQVDGDGFIVVDQRNATTLPGLFAAGDVTTTFGENVLIAIGDGARAAASAYEYVLAQSRLPAAESAD